MDKIDHMFNRIERWDFVAKVELLSVSYNVFCRCGVALETARRKVAAEGQLRLQGVQEAVAAAPRALCSHRTAAAVDVAKGKKIDNC